MTTALDRTPTSFATPHRAARWRAPTLIGILGFLISVVGAWIPSIWYDEAATISSATRSWAQLWAEIGTVDLVHALYYAGMHVWFDLVGYTPVTLRLPSAVAIGVAAALVVVLGRQLDRARLGIIAGLVFVLLPRVTWAGTEGRSYALTALLAVALTVVLVAGQRSPRHPRRWWIVYGALALVSVATFVYLALVVVAHAVTMLWRMRYDSPTRATSLWWFAATTTAGIIALPFVYATSRQSGQLSWLHPIGSKTFEMVFRDQWFMGNDRFAVAAWAAIAVGTALLVRAAWRRGGENRGRGARDLAAIAIPALIVPPASLLLITATYTPLYTPRYLTMVLPFIALLIGAAIDALRSRRLIALALAATLALSLPTIIEQRAPRAKERTDWGAVAALIDSERQAAGPSSRTAMIFGSVQYHPRATARVISYGYPDAFVDITDVTLATSAAASGKLWETQNPLISSLDKLTGIDVVYLLTSRTRDDTVAVTTVIDDLGWRITDDTMIGDVRIVKYER